MRFLDFLTGNRKSCELLVDPDGTASRKYRDFKEFLRHNHKALSAIADLESLYHQGAFSLVEARKRLATIDEAGRALLDSFASLTSGRYATLSPILDRLDEEAATILTAATPAPVVPSVLPLEAITPDMAPACGTKSTNLATMSNLLGLPIPAGFVVTVRGFERFIEQNDLGDRIGQALARFAAANPEPERNTVQLELISAEIRRMIMDCPVPAELAAKILDAYAELERKTHPGVRIAMRSSAVGEDTEASFAGQYVTVLNVTAADILKSYKEVLASKYAPRSIIYRLSYGLEDRDTPMCVAGIVMISSQASGVVYTVDPAEPDSGTLKIAALLGLGELLAAGEGNTDVFQVDRQSGNVLHMELTEKTHRLVCRSEGGIRLETASDAERTLPAIDEATVRQLYQYGMQLEAHFKAPQDIEWALDDKGQLFILQSRPLGLVRSKAPVAAATYEGHPRLITRGRIASPGTAIGPVFNALGRNPDHAPEGAILVARTASPDIAGLLGRVRGIITDVGSSASHLASVAREFGIPALFDTRDATSTLPNGSVVTLVADSTSVYEGVVPQLESRASTTRKPFFDSPAHHKLRRILDLVSPLHLTDPRSPEFTPEHCASIHDIIRFAHETAMREMFGMSQDSHEEARAVRLHVGIPLMLYCIDLGGGLDEWMTTCDELRPEHVESIPLRALIDGLTHPGIVWQGGVAMNMHSFMSVMASTATAETEDLGGDSYAIISRDYMNLSAKFGYHYANIDALCCERASQNHVILKFAGGAGSYFGRSLRITFVATVLKRLGYAVDIRGDVLEATLSGLGPDDMQDVLDQTGRLLASARLLDMTISTSTDVDHMVEMFFDEEYDFLGNAPRPQVEGFYTDTGNWSLVEVDGERCIRQDGSEWGRKVGRPRPAVFARMFGPRYQETLDTVETFFNFPLAICKESRISDGLLQLKVKPEAGEMDRAGGLAFGIRNTANYHVLRINAVENNIILNEFLNNRRTRLVRVETRIRTGKWYALGVEVRGRNVTCTLDGETVIETTLRAAPYGFAGLWTRGDSVTLFKELQVEPLITEIQPHRP